MKRPISISETPWQLWLPFQTRLPNDITHMLFFVSLVIAAWAGVFWTWYLTVLFLRNLPAFFFLSNRFYFL